MQNHLSCAIAALTSKLDQTLLTRCSLCQTRTKAFNSPWRDLLCEGCYQEWVIEKAMASGTLSGRHCCQHCGLAFEQAQTTQTPLTCGQCLSKAPVFDYCDTLFDYQYPLQHWIKQIKHHQAIVIARRLSLLLALHIQHKVNEPDRPSVLIPVPQSPKRARELGFNPAYIIAKQISHSLAIPIATNWLTSNPDHQPQKSLTALERMKNMENAFDLNHRNAKMVKDELQYQANIAIVDDVFTTGATATSLARLLKDNGARRVGVWALARTPKPNKKLG